MNDRISLPSYAEFKRAQVALAESCKNKEPEELSESEKFAICLLSGVKIKTHSAGDTVVVSTASPCGIAKIDGQFQVHILNP